MPHRYRVIARAIYLQNAKTPARTRLAYAMADALEVRDGSFNRVQFIEMADPGY